MGNVSREHFQNIFWKKKLAIPKKLGPRPDISKQNYPGCGSAQSIPDQTGLLTIRSFLLEISTTEVAAWNWLERLLIYNTHNCHKISIKTQKNLHFPKTNWIISLNLWSVCFLQFIGLREMERRVITVHWDSEKWKVKKGIQGFVLLV